MKTGGYVTTFTGKNIVLANPNPDLFCIEDIAHHLSQLPHWNGAAKYHYSIAQHSLLVVSIAPRELQRLALMHDAAEYVYGDDTRPKKELIPECRRLEKACTALMAEKFDFDWPESAEFKVYDDMALTIESLNLMPPGAFPEGAKYYDRVDNLEWNINHMTPKITPEDAELLFLRKYYELF